MKNVYFLTEGDGEYITHKFRRFTPLSNETVKSISKGTNSTQSEFTNHYGFDVTTLRSWEQGKRKPNNEATILLKMITLDASSVRGLIKRIT